VQFQATSFSQVRHSSVFQIRISERQEPYAGRGSPPFYIAVGSYPAVRGVADFCDLRVPSVGSSSPETDPLAWGAILAF